jgi:glycosyltransferase involved in cell wall biosynthesis
MPAMLKRLKIQAEDTLRYNSSVRNLLASTILFKAPGAPATSAAEAARAVHKLCQAARLAASNSMMLKAEAAIARQLPAIDPRQVPWAEFLPDFGLERIHKTIVLKRYVSEHEKGVVFVSFDNQMARLAKAADLAEFARRYTLVLSPQWSPPHSIASYLFPLLYPDPIFCLISNERDLVYFPRIDNRYVMAQLYASSWVDARQYTPVPYAEKDIDIFMLANFAKYKRHHEFFKALKHLPRHYRVVLNGQRESGRTRETLLQEAAAFGVQDRFEIKENVSEQELHNNFVRTKVSLIFSRREGSCVAVIESMFANTPVGLFEDAEIGSRVFIGPQTGRLLRHENLAAQIKDFVESSAQCQPRKWALDNGVDCVASSQKLNRILKEHTLAHGSEWTEDIATLRWRPNPQYYDPQDAERLRPCYEEIESCCGIRIDAPKQS